MKFRKKPVVIDAIRFNGWNSTEIEAWMIGFGSRDKFGVLAGGNNLAIQTLEGEMRATAGDWIIRGVKGEFYPCKPDIFEATYEPVLCTSPPLSPTEEDRERAKAMAQEFFYCFCDKPAPKGWSDACPLHNYEPDFIRMIASALAAERQRVLEWAVGIVKDVQPVMGESPRAYRHRMAVQDKIASSLAQGPVGKGGKQG